MPAAGSVSRHLPDEQARADIADVALTIDAKSATAARWDERERYVIPWLDRRHARPDLCDDTSALVTTKQREPVRRRLTACGQHLGGWHHVAGKQMVIGVADSGDGHPHQDFTVAGGIKIDLADLPIHADPADHSGATFHNDLLCDALGWRGADQSSGDDASASSASVSPTVDPP